MNLILNEHVILVAAVVCWGPDEPWKLEDITVDPPKASEVRVKLLYASVCHSDLLGSRGSPVVSSAPHQLFSSRSSFYACLVRQLTSDSPSLLLRCSHFSLEFLGMKVSGEFS